ncbi:serine hydrolase [Candidatus Harpocratesius sp.]
MIVRKRKYQFKADLKILFSITFIILFFWYSIVENNPINGEKEGFSKETSNIFANNTYKINNINHCSSNTNLLNQSHYLFSNFSNETQHIDSFFFQNTFPKTSQNSDNFASSYTSQYFSQYFSQIIPDLMDKQKIPGGIVSIVNQSDTIYRNGWGFADVYHNKSMSPENIEFSMGELSAIVSWILFMQFWEQGKINLSARVNTYLKKGEFSIPEIFPTPILVTHLISHTAGFEDTIIGTEAKDINSTISLNTYIKEYMPLRVRKPGHLSVYSNYDVALGAYLLELLSGQAFLTLFQNQIAIPLELNDTDFTKSIISDISSSTSSSSAGSSALPNSTYCIGYQYKERLKQFTEIPQTIVNDVPARGMKSTTYDFEKILQMLLNNGTYRDKQILDSNTVQFMQTPLFKIDSRLPGVCIGFQEQNYNGIRLLSQYSEFNGISSAAILIPEKNLGIFLVFNAVTGMEAIKNLIKDFCISALNGSEEVNLNITEDFNKRANQYIGAFRTVERPYTTVKKIYGLLTEEIIITNPGGNTLRMNSKQILIEIGKDLFLNNQTKEKVFFLRDESGEIHYLIFENSPMTAFEKSSVLDIPIIHKIIPITALTTFLSTIILGFILFIHNMRKKYKSKFNQKQELLMAYQHYFGRKERKSSKHLKAKEHANNQEKKNNLKEKFKKELNQKVKKDVEPPFNNSKNEIEEKSKEQHQLTNLEAFQIIYNRRMQKLAIISLITMSSFYLLFAGIYYWYDTTVPWFQTGYSQTPMILIFILPLVARLINLSTLVFWLNVWRDKYWTRWRRIHYGFVCTIGLLSIWWLYYWNYFGFNF